jgi:hypothetical protein
MTLIVSRTDIPLWHEVDSSTDLSVLLAETSEKVVPKYTDRWHLDAVIRAPQH